MSGFLSVGVVLRCWSCELAARHLCGVFFWKNGSLDQCGDQRLITFNVCPVCVLQVHYCMWGYLK